MTFDLIPQGGILLPGNPSPWHHQSQSQLSSESLSKPASPKFRDWRALWGWGSPKLGTHSSSLKHSQQSSFQSAHSVQTSSYSPTEPGALGVPARPWAAPSFPLVPAGPHVLEPGRTDGLKQAVAELLPRAGGGRPELLFKSGAQGPRSWRRILAKLPRRLGGQE